MNPIVLIYLIGAPVAFALFAAVLTYMAIAEHYKMDGDDASFLALGGLILCWVWPAIIFVGPAVLLANRNNRMQRNRKCC